MELPRKHFSIVLLLLVLVATEVGPVAVAEAKKIVVLPRGFEGVCEETPCQTFCTNKGYMSTGAYCGELGDCLCIQNRPDLCYSGGRSIIGRIWPVQWPSLTAVPVARAAVTNSSTFYGLVVVIDDPLTDGPDRNSSKLLGRAQGFYAGAGKETMTLVMNMMLVFHGGEYNGSSVAIMGRNQVFTAVREMPIVGGTGVFRLARGYVQVRTHTLDLDTGDAILQYNLFIKH
ncbi:hypothetical protein ACP4OV_003139 [Aristida adscensionis]